jgi:hypothetical protein
MNKDIVSIDIQGFLGNNKQFILKEIGVVFSNTNINISKLNCHFIIHSPYDFTKLNKHLRKTAAWMTKNHHKICWNDGLNYYREAQRHIRKITSGKQIICKGYEKQMFLKRFLKTYDITDIHELGSPKLKEMNGNQFPFCLLHCMEGVCALNNAHKILNYFESCEREYLKTWKKKKTIITIIFQI